MRLKITQPTLLYYYYTFGIHPHTLLRHLCKMFLWEITQPTLLYYYYTFGIHPHTLLRHLCKMFLWEITKYRYVNELKKDTTLFLLSSKPHFIFVFSPIGRSDL